MMIELLKSVVVSSFTVTDGGANGPVAFTSTGDKMVLTALAPIRLLKWGFLITGTAMAQTSSAFAMKLSMRPTAGSDTNRVDLDTLTTVASSSYALGFGGYRETYAPSTANVVTPPSTVPAGGPLGNTGNTIEAGQQQYTLAVGQQWVIDVTTASDNTGTGKLFFEYVLLPISKPSQYGATNAGTVSLTENYTQFAS